MRVLVTGATGFLGRHLVAALRGAGHEVVGTGFGHELALPGVGILEEFHASPCPCRARTIERGPDEVKPRGAIP